MGSKGHAKEGLDLTYFDMIAIQVVYDKNKELRLSFYD